jgi:iron(III) transport system substrate-binding protein
MQERGSLKLGLAVALAMAGALASAPAFAAELSKALQGVLKSYKVDESVLSGLDKDLDVPAAWIDAAKKEGAVKILDNLTDAQFRNMSAPFRERYPFLKISYSQSTYQARTTRILVAFKAGNFPADVITDFGGFYATFKENDVLADLSDMPTFKELEPGTRGQDGTWVGYRRQYWCGAYNTNLVKKADLPKTWDDLLTNPAWRNHNLALGNRPQLWILMLWNENGEEATKRYVQRLFGEVKPQLRMEGMDMLPALAGAGEFSMIVPTSEFQVQQLQTKGAPLSFHCPEPVPATVAMKGIVKGSPNQYAAKLYLNWLLSKEGQIMQARISDSIPVRTDLQRAEFIPFADQIVGKKTAFRSLEAIDKYGPTVQKFWNESWSNAGGALPPPGSGGGSE